MDLSILANSTGTAIQSLIAFKQHKLNNKIEELFSNFEKKQNTINASFLLKINKIGEVNENVSNEIYNFIENNNEKNLLEKISEIIDTKNKLLLKELEKKIEKNNENIITKINNLDNNIKELQSKKKKKKIFLNFYIITLYRLYVIVSQ